MGTLLDAYAIVAFLTDEPAAADVEPLIRAGDARLTPVQLAEVADVTSRVHGVPLEDVQRELAHLLLTNALELTPFTQAVAWRAAELRLGYYDRRRSPLSLADCVLLASAGPDDAIATADPSVTTVARAEGLETIALRDPRGRRR